MLITSVCEERSSEIFNKRAQDLDDQDLSEFSLALIESLKGIFAVQDWNLYDINLLLVPSTNNGNEGQNQRFKENFGIHPKLWNFFLTLVSVRNLKVDLLIFLQF